MSITYPPAPPVTNGDYVTVSKFLNSTPLVAQRMTDLARLRLVGTLLLTGRTQTESGAINFELDDAPLEVDRKAEKIAPGAEYPLTTLAKGTSETETVVKVGQDIMVTDESISRQGMSPAERAMNRLVASASLRVDRAVNAKITEKVKSTIAAGNKWDGVGDARPEILKDVLRAKAAIAKRNKGYIPNVLMINDDAWALLASDERIAATMAREDKSNSVYSGRFEVLAGLQVIVTPQAPDKAAFIFDSTQLGGIATENLQGGYAQAGEVIQTKSMREDSTDGWRLRARTVCVPYITNPDAGIKLTGVL